MKNLPEKQVSCLISEIRSRNFGTKFETLQGKRMEVELGAKFDALTNQIRD
jgi:hypothetical protein